MSGISGVSGVQNVPNNGNCNHKTGVIKGTIATAGLAATGSLASDYVYLSYKNGKASKEILGNTFFSGVKEILTHKEIAKECFKKSAIAAGVVGGLYLLYRGVKTMFSKPENK